MIIDEDAHLEHYGILRRSGRYPWGSGGNGVPGDYPWSTGSTQNVRNRSYLDYIAEMKAKGLNEVEIARGQGISTTQLRAAKKIANNQQKQARIGQAQRLHDKGMSNVAAAAKMGIPESSFRALIAPGEKAKVDILTSTSAMLKRQVDEKEWVDIGSGVENHLKVSKEMLNTAAFMLTEQGYMIHKPKIRQLGTGLDTELKVLSLPDTTWGDAQRNVTRIKQITEFSDDGGLRFGRIHDPISVKPSRVSVRYREEGGAEADGVIFVRPGVDDVSLGKSRYAQVRIQVGEGHYLKGMAMYKDDLPSGTDLLFNTNKESTGNKLDAMKELNDENNGLPFGSVIRRQILADPNTDNERVTSVMNIVYEEGSWTKWSRNLSSQFLSKQNPALARSQLNMTYERRKNSFDEIMALTNPTIKKKLLEKFSDGTDSAAVHLKAAALPKSNWHAILPIESMPPSQIYAPGYENGERVVLIRYPHGGLFEIPELTVNNRQPEAKSLLAGARDAVGIHHSVAERLSGADFDGDTVLVISNNSGKVKHSPALEALKNFNPRLAYPRYEGMPKLSVKRKNQLMGDVSNLLTDMTLKAASHEDISRAVRHSMVIIDAEKHDLNYKQSAIDRGIKQLKEKYQGASRGGASTLISRKKSTIYLPERKDRPQSRGGPIDKATGRKVTVETGRTKLNRAGERELREKPYNKLAITDDAFTLSSGTPMEKIYAEHSNKLKALANRARLAASNTPSIERSPSAAKAYANEVASLNSKLFIAQKNRPLERQSQILATAVVRANRDANPNLDNDTRKKLEYKALTEARIRTGAKKREIKITQEEWDAIQAGAISNSKLDQILNKADIDQVRSLAAPRVAKLMTTAKTQRAQSMLASGFTRAEVASQLGVSLTTLDTATIGDDEDD